MCEWSHKRRWLFCIFIRCKNYNNSINQLLYPMLKPFFVLFIHFIWLFFLWIWIQFVRICISSNILWWAKWWQQHLCSSWKILHTFMRSNLTLIIINNHLIILLISLITLLWSKICNRTKNIIIWMWNYFIFLFSWMGLLRTCLLCWWWRIFFVQI